MIRAVVFDLWNTLIHSPGGNPFKQVRALLNDAQHEAFPAFVREAMTTPGLELRPFLAAWQGRLGLSEDQRGALVDAFEQASREARPYPDALDTLTRTRQLGRIALLSNTPAFGVPLLDTLGLREPFRVLGLSAELGTLKPELAAFEALQKRLALFPGNLVMVGDSWTDDVAGALAAGWTAIWVNRNGAPRPDHDPDAELVEVADLGLVPEVVARLQAGARCSTCLG